MTATSESLKKPNKVVADSANEIVKSYLKSIDAAINSAPKKLGWNGITYQLPTFFPLEGLDKKSGQVLIYTLILDDLKKRELDAKLAFKKDTTILVVRFEITPNSAEIETMKNYIKDNSIDMKDIDKFIKGKI